MPGRYRYPKGMSMTKDANRKSYVYGPLMHDFSINTSYLKRTRLLALALAKSAARHKAPLGIKRRKA